MKKYSDAKDPLSSWLKEVKKATWNTPQDVKNRYGSADFAKNNHVIINIRGNHYRLIFQVNYKSKVVIVKEFGKHETYDNWKV